LPRVAVLKFPGTNCEDETAHAVRDVGGASVSIVWHLDFRWRDWDAIIIPGGFSYGDYGRAGLLASLSPAIAEVKEAVENGVPVLGICNGFQVLVESGLLPGALLPNDSGWFIARWVTVVAHNPRGPWLTLVSEGERLDMPIAHAEGRYYYSSPDSIVSSRPWLEYGSNPNGSVYNIAGIASADGLVLGLMPHPERATWPWQAPPGYTPGGRRIFESIGYSLRRGW